MSDLAEQTRWMDAVDQAALVAHGDVTPVELLEAAIERMEALDPAIHALTITWFDHARAILIGRTSAPPHAQMSQDEAVLDALGRLGLPIVLDLEIGHVPPQLPLVNGARATLTVTPSVHELSQSLR